MKISIRKGLGFGLTSGIITTLGLIVGLNSGTHSKSIILGGILVIAIADAFSDSLGIHISEESGSKTTKQKEIWESTISTFLFKLIFALSFIIPILLFKLQTAIIISVVWGLFLLTAFSFYISKTKNLNPTKAIAEHLIIAILVIFISNFIGSFINKIFV
jgi:VIT1/CCC1 family predicted Fe2+/Mn2+ transporter